MGKWQVSSLIARCTQCWKGSEVGMRLGYHLAAPHLKATCCPYKGHVWRSHCGTQGHLANDMGHSTSFFPSLPSRMLSHLDGPCFDTQAFSPDHVFLETGTTCLLKSRKFGQWVWFSFLAFSSDSSQLQRGDIIRANTYAAFTMGQVLSLALFRYTCSNLTPPVSYCAAKQDHWSLF